MVALVLAFMNDVLAFSVNSKNFLDDLTEIAKFLVLCFVLLGTFKITQSLVNGTGAENWAAQMGSLMAFGMAHRTMGILQKAGIASGIKAATGGATTIKSVSSGVSPILSTGAYVASRPVASAIGSAYSGFKEKVGDSAAKIHQEKGVISSQNSKDPIIKGRYESNFQKIAAERSMQNGSDSRSIKNSISPINHFKAMKDSTMQITGEVGSRIRESAGIPLTKESLTFKEKATLATNQIFNGGEVVNNSIQKESFSANRNTLNEVQIAEKLQKMNFSEMLEKGDQDDRDNFRAD